jgi:hypothetical protein
VSHIADKAVVFRMHVPDNRVLNKDYRPRSCRMSFKRIGAGGSAAKNVTASVRLSPSICLLLKILCEWPSKRRARRADRRRRMLDIALTGAIHHVAFPAAWRRSF